MTELSDEALNLCARFFTGEGKTLVSDLPHETLASIAAPMTELRDAGLITQEIGSSDAPIGRIVFRGTAASNEVGRRIRLAALARPLSEPQR